MMLNNLLMLKNWSKYLSIKSIFLYMLFLMKNYMILLKKTYVYKKIGNLSTFFRVHCNYIIVYLCGCMGIVISSMLHVIVKLMSTEMN